MHAFGGLAGEANLSLRADKNEDEIKALIKERRDVDKKKQRQSERCQQTDQKVHQGQEEDEEARKDSKKSD